MTTREGGRFPCRAPGPFLSWLVLAASCGHPAALAPVAFAPSSRQAFEQAAAATLPTSRTLYRLSWRSDDGQVQYGGNAAARVAPPDSLRADVAATLGLGRSAVILTGEDIVAQPPEVVDQFLPDRFALWALFGIVRQPPGAVSFETAADGARTQRAPRWKR